MIRFLRFGNPNSSGKCPDKKFMGTSSILMLLGSNGIWPLSRLELKCKYSKLVQFRIPGGIAPLILLLVRIRVIKLVRCSIVFGNTPVILLLGELKADNLLEAHCGNFSTNSVILPEDRLLSRYKLSSSHRFFKSTVIVAAFPL